MRLNLTVLTNLDREARRQTQSDEVTQLSEQGVRDRHEINDRHHLFCQGKRVGLTQPQLSFKPGNEHTYGKRKKAGRKS